MLISYVFLSATILRLRRFMLRWQNKGSVHMSGYELDCTQTCVRSYLLSSLMFAQLNFRHEDYNFTVDNLAQEKKK